MRSEYYLLCRYLSISAAASDKNLQSIFEKQFGASLIKERKFFYFLLYFKDTTQSILKINTLLHRKLIFLCAMLEASKYSILLLPSRKNSSFLVKFVTYFLMILSKLQIILLKLSDRFFSLLK